MATFTVGESECHWEISVTVAMCANVVWVQETKTGVWSTPAGSLIQLPKV